MVGSQVAIVMGDTTRDRVSVSGPSHLEEVDAEVFNASGATEVDGDVRADIVDVSGATDIGGRLVTEELDASGSLEVQGEGTVEEADIGGASEFGGDLTAGELDTGGALEVAGRLAVERLDASGAVEAGAVEAESIEASGALKADTITATTLESSGRVGADEIDGETIAVAGGIEADHVSAETFRLQLGGDVKGIGIRFGVDNSTIDHLVADEVHVGEDAGDQSALFGISFGPLSSSARFEAETIEAKRVSLEDTTVSELHAKEATLGSGTEVETLYSDEYETADDASVGEVREYDGPTAATN